MYGGTRALKDRYASRLGQVAAMVDLAPGGFWVGAGGVLIIEKGETLRVVGGVGVSGASADEDEHCALTGAQGKLVFLFCVPKFLTLGPNAALGFLTDPVQSAL